MQATLPHSDPKANEFVRRNGHFTLSILAPKDVGLPYGRYPRLVLAYLTTEAVRRKSPDIELGSHFSHFCAALGIPPTTGPRGSLPQLRDQLQRLFASTFQCIFHDESQGRHAGDGFLIAEKRELWWDPRPNPRHFKKRFLGYLRSVIDYYPDVRLESSVTGLLLKPSPTHIEQRPATRSSRQRSPT